MNKKMFEIAVTDFCNLNCALCSQGTPYQKNKKTITLDEISAFSRLIEPNEFDVLKISGGEPTLHPQFGEICDQLRNLFKASRYELATNGFRLENYLDRIHVFDVITLAHYPGKNDAVIQRFGQLKIPNVIVAPKEDYDTMEDVHQQKNLGKSDIFAHCRYAFPKLVQNRIYACCVLFGQSIRQNIDAREISVPADENWRQNLSLIDPQKHCEQCFVDVETAEMANGAPTATVDSSLQPQRASGGNGLTIFALPKAFSGTTGLLQRNAIRSWMQLSPAPEIILMGDDDGVAEYAHQMGLRHIPDVCKNNRGTPLVSDIFSRAQRAASNDVLMYINSDIMLMDDFQAALGQVRQKFSEFLMIGQRWNHGINDEIDFDAPGWQDRLRKSVYERGTLYAVTGIDYFAFSRNLWPSIPDFAIGRTVWDNWLIWKPMDLGKVVVDATDLVMAVHQDHEYVPSPGRCDEEAVNRSFAEKCQFFGYTCNTPWKCTPAGIVIRNPGEFIHSTRWPQVFDHISRTLPHAPKLVEKQCRHAIACMFPARLKEIGKEAQAMLQRQPGHAGAALMNRCIADKLLSIGLIMKTRAAEYLQAGKPQESLKWFDAVADMGLPAVQSGRAMALASLGDYLSAKEACLQELKSNQHDTAAASLLADIEGQARAFFAAGFAKLQQNNCLEALTDFESAAQRSQLPNLNYAKAVALSRLGRYGSAQHACTQELNIQSDHRPTVYLLAKIESTLTATVARSEDAFDRNLARLMQGLCDRSVSGHAKIEQLLRRPRYIKMETTNVCNARCSFCAYELMTRPKTVMPAALFQKAIDDYIAIGSGPLTLSPEVGDCLTDAEFLQRLRYCGTTGRITEIGIHTNLISLEKWTDAQVSEMLMRLSIMNISLGPNRTVYSELFGVDKFETVIAGLERLARLRKSVASGIVFSLNGRSCGSDFKVDDRLSSLSLSLMGKPVEWVTSYSDWGGATRQLPLNTPVNRASEGRVMAVPCVKTLTSSVIFSDGRVGVCGCADFDAKLIIGNVAEQDLGVILSGLKRKQYIASFFAGRVNEYCRKCTFYEPVTSEWISSMPEVPAASSLRPPIAAVAASRGVHVALQPSNV